MTIEEMPVIELAAASAQNGEISAAAYAEVCKLVNGSNEESAKIFLNGYAMRALEEKKK